MRQKETSPSEHLMKDTEEAGAQWWNGQVTPCQKRRDLTYQKQVQIHSNWENERMPEKTIKRAKKTSQKKHRVSRLAFRTLSLFF